jgi:tryptophan synthase alpha chain
VDGLIVVDLPPEEDAELCDPARAAGIDFVRLATPTTDPERLPAVLKNAAGFVYYVSVAGVTGGRTGPTGDIGTAVSHLRQASGLPVAVGFGIKTEQRAAEVARVADAVVVGSALVEMLADDAEPSADARVKETVSFAARLSHAIKTARI